MCTSAMKHARALMTKLVASAAHTRIIYLLDISVAVPVGGCGVTSV